MRLIKKHSDKLLSDININSGTGVFEITPDGCYLSDELLYLAGYSEDELTLDLSFIADNIIHKDDRELFLKAHSNQSILSGRKPINLLYRIITKGGDIKYIIESAFIETDNNSNLSRLFGRVIDITIAKQAEDELKAAKEKAEKSEKLMSAFLANISHEIRTPLNGILGFVELLKLPNISDIERGQFLSDISNSGHKLLNIINNILDISKIESGLAVIEKNKFALNLLIDDLENLFQPQISSKNGNVSLVATKALNFSESYIYSDEGRIRQALINLIDNAIKFTEKGAVEFGYETGEPNSVRFYVKDTGIGILESKQSEIFDRFVQAHESHNNKYGGTGLGLSITKGFIELLGGTITCCSTLNKGTTFYFSIPLD